MIHPLNKYFDKIFLISIKRNSSRLLNFSSKYPTIEFEIFPGVDGKELFPSIEFIKDFPIDFFKTNNLSFDRCKVWNKGQLGCAMSNYLVQQEIVKRKLNKVLILEDDALLLENMLDYFQSAILELPEYWDLFYLGFNPLSKWSENSFTRFLLKLKHFIRPTITEGLSSGNLCKRYFPSSFSTKLNKPGLYGGTHAYALTYEGALKILDIDTPLKFGFDTTLMYANYNMLLKSISLKKPLFVPNPIFDTSLVN